MFVNILAAMVYGADAHVLGSCGPCTEYNPKRHFRTPNTDKHTKNMCKFGDVCIFCVFCLYLGTMKCILGCVFGIRRVLYLHGDSMILRHEGRPTHTEKVCIPDSQTISKSTPKRLHWKDLQSKSPESLEKDQILQTLHALSNLLNLKISGTSRK